MRPCLGAEAWAKAAAAAAVVVAASWTAGCNMIMPAGPVVHEHHVVERGKATSARVEIDMGAGELSLKSGAKGLLEGDFDFNIPTLKPAIAYDVDGGTGALKVSQGSASGDYENSWRLSLDETTPLDLHVNLGAGDAQLVLGRLSLQSLTSTSVRATSSSTCAARRPEATASAWRPAPAIRRFTCRPASAFPRARRASLATPTSAASWSARDAGSTRGRKGRLSRSNWSCDTPSAI